MADLAAHLVLLLLGLVAVGPLAVACTQDLPAPPHVGAAARGEPIARWIALHDDLIARLEATHEPDEVVDELERWLDEHAATRAELVVEVDAALLDTAGRVEARYLDALYGTTHRLAALRRRIELDLAQQPRLLIRFRRAARRLES